MARYEFNDQVSVHLNINNLFDKHYIGSAEFGGAYGEPRSILATVNARF